MRKLLGSLLALAPFAAAQITYDNAVVAFPAGAVDSTSPVTWNYTMGTCSSNGFLIALVGRFNSGVTITSMSYNSVASSGSGTLRSGDPGIQYFYWLNPPPGAHQFSATMSTTAGYAAMNAVARSYCGVSQTTPIGVTANAAQTTGSPGISITPVTDNSWAIDFLFSGSNGNVFGCGGSGWTHCGITNFGANGMVASQDNGPIHPAAAVTSSDSSSSVNWVEGALTLNPAIAGPSFTVLPATIPAHHSGNITLSLAGTGTTWGSATRFTLSGVTGAACVTGCNNSPTVTDGTHVAVVVTTGGGTGTLTLTESVTGTATATTTVSAATLGINPTSGATSTMPSLTMTGTNTLWSSETAAGLFTVSGGTGSSIATPAITSNTSGTVTLTTGSATGTMTITDTSTNATATFTVDSGSLTAGSLSNAGTVGLNLTTAIATGGTPPYSYQWQRSAHGANTWSNICTNSTNCNDDGLTPGTIYDYRVTVTDSVPANATSATFPLTAPGGSGGPGSFPIGQ